MPTLPINANQANLYTPQKDPFAAFKISTSAKITTQTENDEFIKKKKAPDKKVLIGLGAAAAAVLAYVVAIRKLEANFFKNQFNMDEIIPQLKDGAKSFLAKTSKGQNIDLWDINPKNSEKYLVFCNGISNNKQQNWLQEVYAKLSNSEYGVIAFDYSGRGKSPGKFSQKGAYESIEAVFEHLKSKGVKQENIGIVGHSLGCGAAADFAKKNDVSFLVMVNPFNKLKDMIKGAVQYLDAPKSVKSALEKTPSWMIPIKNTFNNEKAIKTVQKPVFIMSSIDDQEIPVDLARKLYEKTKNAGNITFKEFAQGDHNFTDEKIEALWKFIRNK